MAPVTVVLTSAEQKRVKVVFEKDRKAFLERAKVTSQTVWKAIAGGEVYPLVRDSLLRAASGE